MRLKTQIEPVIQTRDDAEAAMNELALTVNNQRRIITQRDKEILGITEQWANKLAEISDEIKTLTEQLRVWADTNSDQFPKDRKSIELASGKLGFRTGTPKLALYSRSFTWDKVLGFIRSKMPEFIRTKEEVDKEAILGGYSMSGDKPKADADLRSVGLRVTQDESFFIEPDLTTFEQRLVEKA